MSVRTRLDFFEQSGVVLGRRTLPAGQSKPELLQETAQVLKLLRRRSFVNAIQTGLFVLFEKS